MNLLGLWAIIFSAVALGQFVCMALGTLMATTKWYRKWISKQTKDLCEDLGYLVETEKEEPDRDFIK